MRGWYVGRGWVGVEEGQPFDQRGVVEGQPESDVGAGALAGYRELVVAQGLHQGHAVEGCLVVGAVRGGRVGADDREVGGEEGGDVVPGGLGAGVVLQEEYRGAVAGPLEAQRDLPQVDPALLEAIEHAHSIPNCRARRTPFLNFNTSGGEVDVGAPGAEAERG
ncbi:hypothetical protein GCM10007977_011140 [Dactylosporangium sucinum]|uniref:Uncharacterized protein n=1 Tax=Dactylosporangium sucinum TaxID=1424081 RepID=A0A917WKI1_9ACTN|nr:hypothetical protein GCM10007977_011140 [Dactylosporangium sucinum]